MAKNALNFAKLRAHEHTKTPSCRSRLQSRFEESESHESIFKETRRILRTGVEKLCRSFDYVRTGVNIFSKKIRTRNKGRQILHEGPLTPTGATPNTFSRVMLGRTPTKLYSPFSIDTP